MPAYKDKNGTWYVMTRCDDWQGERKQKCKRGFKTKREAQDWERRFLLQQGGDLDMLFGDFYKNNFNHNQNDCCNLRMPPQKGSQQQFSYIGSISLMETEKTAFLCSSYAPQEVRGISKKWALEQCKSDRCIISGFQSETEKDVLDTILANNGRAIMVLPCSIYEKCPPKLRNAIDNERLLIVSFFEEGQTLINRSNAEKRNRQVLDSAEEVVIGYVKKSGMLSRLIGEITKPVTVLYDPSFQADKEGKTQSLGQVQL